MTLTLVKFSDSSDSFHRLFLDLSAIIEEGRKAAVRQVNTTLVATYWLMGRRIVEFEQKGSSRAEYGEALLRTLAAELTKQFGKGFGYVNLNLMRQFYLTYAPEKILQTASEESLARRASLESRNFRFVLGEIARNLPLSWSHYCLLIRIQEFQKRAFYERLCLDGRWSVRQLEREINALLYERTALSKRKDVVIAKANANAIASRPEDEIKDSYVLDFLGLKDEYCESDLEDALIRHIESFLLELGRGFAFVARQKRFVLDGDEYRIDLLLFHIGLKRYIVCEIKVEKFTHSHAGQINFYINWVKDNILPRAENDPFGIILCADKNNTTVKYATGGLSNKIFVSKYLLELPKPEELQRELQRGKVLFLERQVAAKTQVGKRTLLEKGGGINAPRG